MMNITIILFMLLLIVMIPHKDKISTIVKSVSSPDKENNSGLMNKMTTGVDRAPFETPDDLPYLNNYKNKPFRYRRMEIDPLPEGMIIDDRDPNLKLLQNERCFGN
jgi:hypothetical protein